MADNFARPDGNRQPITNDTPKGRNKMAQPPKTNTPPNRPAPNQTAQKQATAQASVSAPEAAASATNGKGAKSKRPRVRWESDSVPGFWVRSFKDVTDKFGAPRGPDGQPLVARSAKGGGGLSPEMREARKAADEAEKARLAAMTDEERLAYQTKKREERQAKKLAARKAEREQWIQATLASLPPEERAKLEPALRASAGN